MKKMKDWVPGTNSEELCRLEKGRSLASYNQLQLCTEFERLTGESATDILSIVRIIWSEEALRQLVHLTIDHANLIVMPQGQAPQGQALQDKPQVPKAQDKEKEETDVVFIGAHLEQDYRQVCQVCYMLFTLTLYYTTANILYDAPPAEAPDLDLDIQYGKTDEPMDSLGQASGGDSSELDEPMDSPGQASGGDSESSYASSTEL
ncbi:Hypothetical predicted protein, partial [Mytilus galloprovincialis]